MNLRQLGDMPLTRVIEFKQGISMHKTFSCADNFTAPVGTAVKLNSDGTVSAAAATDPLLGVIHVTKNKSHMGKPCVGVSLNCRTEILGTATGAITCGQEVTCDGFATIGSDQVVKYKVAATGQNVVGIATKTSAISEDVTVLVFTAFYKK